MVRFSAGQLAAMRAEVETEYRKDIEAIAALERLAARLPQGIPSHELADDSDAGDTENIARQSLISAVRGAVEDAPNRSHSVGEVFKYLKAIGYPFQHLHDDGGKQAKASVSTALLKLHKRGIIRRVRKGSGNTPNLYRAQSDTTMTAIETEVPLTLQ